MLRLIVLCRHPYHVPRDDAEPWLRQELATVLRREGLNCASLTRLTNPSHEWARDFDRLLEFRVRGGRFTSAMGPGGACAELLADLRLLGMEPAVAVADDRDAVELQLS